MAALNLQRSSYSGPFTSILDFGILIENMNCQITNEVTMNIKTITLSFLLASSPLLQAGPLSWIYEKMRQHPVITVCAIGTGVYLLNRTSSTENNNNGQIEEEKNISPTPDAVFMSITHDRQDQEIHNHNVNLLQIAQIYNERHNAHQSSRANTVINDSKQTEPSWYTKDIVYKDIVYKNKAKTAIAKTTFHYESTAPLYYPHLPESDVNKRIVPAKPGKSILKRT